MFFKVGNFHWPKLQITDNNKQLLTLFLDCKVHGVRYWCHINLVAVFMLKRSKCRFARPNRRACSQTSVMFASKIQIIVLILKFLKWDSNLVCFAMKFRSQYWRQQPKTSLHESNTGKATSVDISCLENIAYFTQKITSEISENFDPSTLFLKA